MAVPPVARASGLLPGAVERVLVLLVVDHGTDQGRVAEVRVARTYKNGLERRVSRFCTICDKNQPLNVTK